MIQTDLVALQYSQRLEEQIKANIIANDNKLSFAEFMQQVLYTPGLGYYSAGSRKFGAGGDFITAPELGSLFAKCVATQIAEILPHLNANTILEFGAGSGQLAADILCALETNNIAVAEYLIVELSADLRSRQQEKIWQEYPQFKDVVKWLDYLPSDLNAVIIANEVLDAMPVDRFYYANDQLQEYYVTIENDQFTFCLDAPNNDLQAAFTQHNISAYISQPYSSEINLLLTAWCSSVANCLKRGAVIICDYGFPRTEYYHPQRNTGTLMCHYQHRCHGNPLSNIGLQDITAHVDFTALAEAMTASGFNMAGYTNFASFLLNCNLLDFATNPSFQQAHELNTLTSPAEMGELFKCMGFVKGIDLGLRGFARYDKSHSL